MSDDAHFDALLPPDMAKRAEDVGVRKAGLPWDRTFVLAVLAGAFIALGATFATTVLAGSAALPWGVARLLAGVAFSLGLVLVLVGGAELFTGNTLLVMAWASRRVTARAVLRNWAIVYVGNFVGALGTALFVALSEQYRFGSGQVGATALSIAMSKVSLAPLPAFLLGVLCNGLVCLAVWLSLSARSTVDRVVVIVPPIAAFVACGFEHSVANMYFVPVALLIRDLAPAAFFDAIHSSREAYATLAWGSFLWRNLLPVTLGNMLGGAGLVGTTYWLAYLRKAT